MSNLDEIFTPDQLSFIDRWLPGYRQAKLGLEGETVRVLLQRLVLAYLDWYPFETEEADLDRHTPRERLARSARRELQLRDDIRAALDRVDEEGEVGDQADEDRHTPRDRLARSETLLMPPAKKVRRELVLVQRPRPHKARRSAATPSRAPAKKVTPAPKADWADIPDLSFGSSDTSSAPPFSSPPSSPGPFFRRASPTPAQSPDHEVAAPEKSTGDSQYTPITFEEWVIHLDESWGTRPRTWQEMRRQDFMDEVSAGLRTVPGGR